MKYDFDYSKEKDLILKETRKVSFLDVINAYKARKKLDDLRHKNKKYLNQRLGKYVMKS